MKIAKVLPVVCGLVFQGMAQESVPGLVSVAGTPCASASGPSYLPLLSADGRYVVFVSSAKNLTTNDNLAPYLDVFRHDLVTGETIVISRSGWGPGGANADSAAPSVSSNGQFIAFSGEASDVLPHLDGNNASDVFLSDVSSSSRFLISAAPNGNSPPNPIPTRNLPLSDKPRISGDGRWVAFESFATNLTAETDGNGDSDVFVRDAVSNQTRLVSVALDGGNTAKGRSELSGITADGKYVLFMSTATNVAVDAPVAGYQELYLRDVAAGTTAWIRHSNTVPAGGTGAPAGYNCRWAVMSRDAGVLLYKVEFPGFPHARIHLYDRQAGSNIVVATRARLGTPMDMSSDGRFVAYDIYDATYSVVLWDRQIGTRTTVNGPYLSHSPVVSEDGSIVAFFGGTNNVPNQIYYRNMASFDLRRLSQTLEGAPSAKDHAGSSIVIDPTGQFIVFDSTEDNLVTDDRNQVSDVFIHEVASGETRLISRRPENHRSSTPMGSASITNSCLSSDGNRLLFLSSDSTLVSGDTNRWQDAFLRDLQSDRTFALSTNENGLFSPTNSVRHGILSANGRYALLGVVSGLRASIVRKDLDTGETATILNNAQYFYSLLGTISFFNFSMSANGEIIVYPFNSIIMVANMQTGVQTNVTGSDAWSEPLISPDGRYVTYAHTSSGVLYMSDLQTGQRITIGGGYLRGTAFSQNGEFVVYGTVADSVPALSIFSISGATNAFVCRNCGSPSISANGRFVVYERFGFAQRQVELKDMLTGKTTLVTRGVNGISGGNADTRSPIINADGRYVAYTTKATNLTLDLPNGWNNLYVYDRLRDSTIRLPFNRLNIGYGSGSSSRPVFGPGGNTLVFQSFASDFVGNDFNDARDIFMLQLGEGDTDNDGMSDSWEQTYFGTTERDSSGDFDQDGQSDLAEYLAGTNPTNGQSVFEVLAITSVSTGQRQLIWSAEPGKTYRVEYKDDLAGAAWTSLGQVITASGATASAIDASANGEKRFYRVALVQ